MIDDYPKEDIDDQFVLGELVDLSSCNPFNCLWRGDVSGYDTLHEAQLALMRMLVKACDGDQGQAARIYMDSQLAIGKVSGFKDNSFFKSNQGRQYNVGGHYNENV